MLEKGRNGVSDGNNGQNLVTPDSIQHAKQLDEVGDDYNDHDLYAELQFAVFLCRSAQAVLDRAIYLARGEIGPTVNVGEGIAWVAESAVRTA